MKKLICLISLLLLFTNVSAAEKCKKDEYQRLKAIAKTVNFSYEFNELKSDSGDVVGGTFDIILDNVTTEIKPLIIYSWLSLNYDEFVPDENGTATSKSFKPEGYDPGSKVKITIKGYVPNPCSGEDLLTKTVRLPYFNNYLTSKECKEYPNFKYCKNQFLESDISQKQFDTEFQKYLKSLEKNAPKMVINNTNLYIMIGVAIAVPVLTFGIVTFVKWRKRKEEL